MKTRKYPGDTDDRDPMIRRLLEVDEQLAQQSTAIARDTRPAEDSPPRSHEGEELVAERYLRWIEAIRVASPELIADAFVTVQDESTAEADVAERDTIGIPDPLTAEPTQIGRFRLLRQVGRGGHGLVFLAHDPNLNRQVALKVPRPEVLVTGNLRRRFLREAEAAAALDHPHIVPVYEAGSAGPICYIAAAYCEGMSLSQWLERRGGKVTPHLAARMMAALADAVQHAHDRGVLHRDIKPGNILLEAAEDVPDDDAARAVRLTDFGLARIEQDASDQTISTAIVGTPAYMAPEQAASRRDKIGVATDVYGLGATLYHLLTGRPPIVGATQWDTLSAITRVDPLEPRRFQAEIPPDLNAICLKCLEKDPARRYPTAAALQADLRRFLQGEAVVARPIGPAQRTIKWCRRNPALSVLVATSATAVLIALVTAAFGWWSTYRALAQADRRYWETKEAVDKYFVAVSENQLLSAPGLKPLRQELLGTALAYYERFLDEHRGDAQLLEAVQDAQLRIGQIHEDTGDFDTARSAFGQALRIVEQRLQNQADNMSVWQKKGMILRQLASLDRHEGQLSDAMARIDAAIEIHQRLADASFELPRNQGQLGLLLRDEASVIQQQGDIPRAEQIYQASAEIFQQLAQEFPQEPRWQVLYAQSLGNRSIMRRFMGQIPESQGLLEEVVNIYRRLVREHPAATNYQFNLGKALANMSTYSSMSRDFETSLDRLREATEVFDRLAWIHPQMVLYHVLRASTRKETGMLLNELGRCQDAQSLLQESLDIVRLAIEDNPTDRRYRDLRNHIRQQLGRALLALGEKAQAVPYLDLAIAEYDAQDQSGRRDLEGRSILVDCLELKARALTRQGRPEEAERLLARGRSLLDELSQELPENRDVRLQRILNLVGTAEALELQERFAEAIQCRTEILQLENASLRNGRSLELATTLARAGDVDQARSLVSAAATPHHPEEWIILARAHAVLAASKSLSPTSVREHQQRAWQAMRQAELAGLAWSRSEYPPTHPDWARIQ